MRVVKGIYDGGVVKLLEPIEAKEKTPVEVVFKEEVETEEDVDRKKYIKRVMQKQGWNREQVEKLLALKGAFADDEEFENRVQQARRESSKSIESKVRSIKRAWSG